MADLLSGRDTRISLLFNTSIRTLLAKTWSVKEVADVAIDGVNGEDRDRMQKVTSHFEIDIDCYDDGGTLAIDDTITNQANEDASLPQLPLGVGILFKYRDGTRKAFACGVCTLGPLEMTDGGRSARYMNKRKVYAQTFTPVPAV